jgi:hypothetical protein
LKKFEEEYRQELGVGDARKLLIGFAWVLPEELRKFRMHPEVLHFDATKGTNKEKLTLLTIKLGLFAGFSSLSCRVSWEHNCCQESIL